MTVPYCNCVHCKLTYAAPELRAALDKIAAWDDKYGNDRLEKTGSYNAFDEPGSVKIAREILTTHALLLQHSPGGEK